MTGRVIAVTGGKGGVGKSTTTINLGVSLRMDGYSVALVDADVEMPNLMEMLSIEADTTIHDVLSGHAEPSEAIVKIGAGFVAIPGDSALSGYGTIEPERLHTVVDTLAATYDYVLLDTGAGLSYDDLFPLGLADEIVLVSSPDPAALENAKRTQSFVHRLNRRIRGLVVTKVEGEVDPTLGDRFDTELLGAIPSDEVVSQSTAAGKPLELLAPDSAPAQAYRQLEANLTDGKLPPKRSTGPPADAEPAGDSPAEDQATEEEPTEEPQPEATTEDEDAEEADRPKRGLVGRLAWLVL